MIDILLKRFSERFLSRWLILAFDMLVVLGLYPLAALIRYNFEFGALDFEVIHYRNLIVATLYLLAFLYTKSYRGVIRQTGLRDAYLVFKSVVIAFGGLMVMSVLLNGQSYLSLSRSVIVIHFLLTLFVLLSIRFLIKSAYTAAIKQNTPARRTRVLIFGSGAAGEITRQSLGKETNKVYEVMGFVDDNPSKQGKMQDGILVYNPNKVLKPEFISDKRIHQLIIAVQNMNLSRRNQLIEKGLELGIKVKVVPPVSNWIQGELTSKQIKAVKIEDLLEREPITLDSMHVSREIQGKKIFVTGAAGSIGSEILRQILYYAPQSVIAIDHAESSLYELEMELLRKHPTQYACAEFVVADVTRADRMKQLFEEHKPQLVFHAAAYKHVPLMEAHPYEAIKVNVFGTKQLADMSCVYQVEKFVMVSTDKAVNPTNVMGASKRIAEMYVQSLQQTPCNTQFITTRFGNVLGSNGSVIPLFRKQIEEGGPITITHPDITRFFMTIPEACNLVLEAGAMGKGGEIYVFDMGESVKIYDLAKKMITLSGLKLGKDIEIKCTGLRPGEKLYEELLADKEGTRPTHHLKIMIAQVRTVDREHLLYLLSALEESLRKSDRFKMVGLMKDIVQEYKSNNSEFSSLDTKKETT